MIFHVEESSPLLVTKTLDETLPATNTSLLGAGAAGGGEYPAYRCQIVP